MSSFDYERIRQHPITGEYVECLWIYPLSEKRLAVFYIEYVSPFHLVFNAPKPIVYREIWDI